MTSRRFSRPHILATAVAGLFATSASAVSLDQDGLGQALIFPYYTVRASEGGNAFNTYISLVNTTTIAKSVRVRFREGRAAKAVLDFNLFLSPNDVWTAALVPVEGSGAGEGGARLITLDRSCTDGNFTVLGPGKFIDFTDTGYAGDGFGSGLERTREGYAEVIEMAALSGPVAAAVTHNSAGVPSNCGYIWTNPVIPAQMLLPPRGGLSGTGTLINVANGRDFAFPATALADLASRSFHRPPSDPYPDFSVPEVDPVSIVPANGHVYRSTWTRGIDAVSAVLMRSEWMAEFVLDNGTRSLTDLIATLPTRRFYVDAAAPTAPFSAAAPTRVASCNEPMRYSWFNRSQRSQTVSSCSSPEPFCSAPSVCAAASVGSIRSNSGHIPPDVTRSAVLGSTTLGFLMGGNLSVSEIQNGWIRMTPTGNQASLTSLPSSMRVDVATGQVTPGAHSFRGLPVIGYALRTFTNGTLSCVGAGSCQGNYGGAFPFRYRRSIAPP